MGTEELRTTIQAVTEGLSSLKEMCNLLDDRDSLATEITRLNGVANALSLQIQNQRQRCQDEAAQWQAAQEKTRTGYELAMQGADLKLADSTRQGQALQARLEEVRRQIRETREKDEADRAEAEVKCAQTFAGIEASHVSRVQALCLREEAAQAELMSLQDRIVALHADLSGAVTRVTG